MATVVYVCADGTDEDIYRRRNNTGWGEAVALFLFSSPLEFIHSSHKRFEHLPCAVHCARSPPLHAFHHLLPRLEDGTDAPSPMADGKKLSECP